MTLRALIFDFDGTLADTEEAHRQAYERAFEEHRLPWRWPARRYRELLRVAGGKERLASFIRSLELPEEKRAKLLESIPAIHRTKTERFAELVARRRIPPLPGVVRIVREAREAKLLLAIASTTTPANVTTLLPALFGRGAESWFATIASGDVVERKKPAPDIFELVLSRLGVPAESCVVFEDAEVGVAAAKAVGLFTVAVPNRWTSGQDLSAADLVLPSLGDPDEPLDASYADRLGKRWLEVERLGQLLAESRAAG